MRYSSSNPLSAGLDQQASEHLHVQPAIGQKLPGRLGHRQGVLAVLL